jgi:hypothetical protein
LLTDLEPWGGLIGANALMTIAFGAVSGVPWVRDELGRPKLGMRMAFDEKSATVARSVGNTPTSGWIFLVADRQQED